MCWMAGVAARFSLHHMHHMHMRRGMQMARAHGQGMYHQTILGDLNTMGHGIARLSRRHCTDALRLRSLGSYEAEVWQADMLSQADPAYAHDPPNATQPAEAAGALCAAAASSDAAPGDRAVCAADPEAGAAAARGACGMEGDARSVEAEPGSGKHINHRLRRWGVSEAVCRDALNPGSSTPLCAFLQATVRTRPSMLLHVLQLLSDARMPARPQRGACNSDVPVLIRMDCL